MKLWLKAYLHYLRKTAKALPLAPFNGGSWETLWEETKALASSVFCFVVVFLLVLTYPISVFIVAAIVCESDRAAAKRRAEALRREGWPEQ